MATPRTIDFTAINDGAHYTIADLNALFLAVAGVINAKLDAALAQSLVLVVVGEDQVMVGADQVILQDPTTARLYAHWSTNFRRIRNLKEGEDAGDAITVAQAKALLGVD